MLTKQFPPAAEAAHHRSDRHIQQAGDFFVGEFLHVGQQHRRSIVGRQSVECPQDLLPRQGFGHGGGSHGGLFQDFLAIRHPPQVEPTAAVMVDIIHQDLEQPCPAVGARLKPGERFPGLQIGLLHDVLGLRTVAEQPRRGPVEVVQMRQGDCFEFVGSWAFRKQYSNIA